MPGHVLGAGPAPPLVLAAVLHGDHLGALADPQARDALGTVDLVAGERQQVDAGRRHVEVELAERLHGVDVEGHAVLAGDARRWRPPAGSVPTSLLACMIEIADRVRADAPA